MPRAYILCGPLEISDEAFKVVALLEDLSTQIAVGGCSTVCVELVEVDLELVWFSEEITDGLCIFGDLGVKLVANVLASGKRELFDWWNGGSLDHGEA